jgi:pimeloyl-ACP methyl ester carboxylesterase
VGEEAFSSRLRASAAIVAAILAAAALLGAACAEGKAAERQKAAKGPHGLAFYKPPKKLPKRHGALIWARKASGLVPLANARYTKLVLYSSRSPQGKRIAVSGSVAVPKGKPPKHGWPIVTWAHGTTGVADVCAPSRDVAGSPTPTGASYIYPELNAWLGAGYAVLRTDYQGLGTPGKHPFLVGKAEGRGVLDIVQAARELDKRIGKRYLIAGHSQGGHAALFAAGEARKWLPKLRLRGTVAFAPASHILEQSRLLSALTSPSGLSALAVMIVDGASTQSKAIDINRILSDRALALYPLLQSQCIGQLGGPGEFGGMPPSELQRSGADLSPLDPVLAAMNPLVRSRAPIQIEQGEADTTVFKLYTDQLVGELNSAGNLLSYKTYPGVNHVDVVTAGEPDALAFFRQVLPPRR